MTGLMKSISEDMARVPLSDIKGPETPLRTGDVKVGQLPDDLKRLYVLHSNLFQQRRNLEAKGLELAAKDLRKLQSREVLMQEALALTKEAEGLATKIDLFGTLFWSSVHFAFPELADKDNVGVRQDWQVVYTNDENQ